MLKWFVDLFFEVEEEIIEEHQEKQIEKPVVRPVKEVAIKPTAQAIEDNPPKQIEVIAKEDNIKKEDKKSIFINDVATTRHDTVLLEKPKEDNNDAYEFTPIISPIFGVDEKHQPKKAQKPIKKPFVESSSAIGTIISPIYGLEIQRSPFSSSYNLTDEDPKINIDLQEMIEVSFDENDIINEESSEIAENNFEEETEELEDVSVDITEDDVVLEIEDNEDLGIVSKPTNIDLEVSEEEKFMEEQQPNLFDYMR